MIITKSKLRQFSGLMFQKPKNILFILDREKRVTLHTFFVFYPIYIIFLDEDKKIISFRRCLPFHPFILSPKCRYIFETIDKRLTSQSEISKIFN